MKFTAALVVLVAASFAMAEAPAPDLSTPKSTMIAYMKAYFESSKEGMRATTTGGENAFTALYGARQCVAEGEKLSAAMVKKFGKPQTSKFRPPDFSKKKLDETLEQIDKAKVEENGAKATVAFQPFVKVDGKWKKDILGGAPDSAHAVLADRNKAILELLTSLTAEVEAGKHATAEAVDKARDDAMKAIDERFLPKAQQPATKPSGG